jgi:hypothetical protein
MIFTKKSIEDQLIRVNPCKKHKNGDRFIFDPLARRRPFNKINLSPFHALSTDAWRGASHLWKARHSSAAPTPCLPPLPIAAHMPPKARHHPDVSIFIHPFALAPLVHCPVQAKTA